MTVPPSQNNLFQDNLRLLQQRFPSIALAILHGSGKEWIPRGDNLILEGTGQSLYPCEHPEEAVEEWANKLQLDKCSALFLHGVGLGFEFSKLQVWLKTSPSNALIFIEHDAGVIRNLLQRPIGSILLGHPQVFLRLCTSEQSFETQVRPLCQVFARSSILIPPSVTYGKSHPQAREEMQRKVGFWVTLYRESTTDYLVSEQINRQYFRNSLQLSKARFGNDLFGKFNGRPAIICGAGPSLNKNYNIIQKMGDRALLIAGGAAISSLGLRGLQPHFGIAVDPKTREYNLLRNNPLKNFPLLYHNRVVNELLEDHEGPRFFLKTANCGPLSGWLEDELQLKEPSLQDSGNSCSTLGITVAHALGCSPIILVGMDLSYKAEKRYAEPCLEEHQPLDSDELIAEAQVSTTDLHGEPVQSTWHWLQEQEWVENFAREHKDCTLINATEGGLGFSGIENVRLQELFEGLSPIGNFDEERKRAFEETRSLEQYEGAIQEALDDMEASLQSCQDSYGALVRYYGQNGEHEPLHPRVGMLEALLEMELAHQRFLKTAGRAYIYPLRTIWEMQKRPSEKEEPRILKKKHYAFLEGAAALNLEVLREARGGAPA